ncbi:hypothetical protein MRX96_042622 [Rhipicephalus microplus]
MVAKGHCNPLQMDSKSLKKMPRLTCLRTTLMVLTLAPEGRIGPDQGARVRKIKETSRAFQETGILRSKKAARWTSETAMGQQIVWKPGPAHTAQTIQTLPRGPSAQVLYSVYLDSPSAAGFGCDECPTADVVPASRKRFPRNLGYIPWEYRSVLGHHRRNGLRQHASDGHATGPSTA